MVTKPEAEAVTVQAVSVPVAAADSTTTAGVNAPSSSATESPKAEAQELAPQDRELSHLLALRNAALEREDYTNALRRNVRPGARRITPHRS